MEGETLGPALLGWGRSRPPGNTFLPRVIIPNFVVRPNRLGVGKGLRMMRTLGSYSLGMERG